MQAIDRLAVPIVDQQNLVEQLGRWLTDYVGPPELVLGFEKGKASYECAVGWLNADGPAAFGHLTLWESGDVAVEIYDAVDGDVLLLSRTRVTTVAHLAAHVSMFIATCTRSPRWLSLSQSPIPAIVLPIDPPGRVRGRLTIDPRSGSAHDQ